MATIYSKVSTQVTDQQPDFIRSDHPDFLAFLKAYYEFLESAELKLKDFGSVDSILFEEGSTTYMILEDTNRYRTNESNNILVEDYDTVGGSRVRSIGAFQNGETITGQTSKATATVRTEDVSNGSRLFISSQNKFQLNEQVVGQTSGATANIVSYTANPVQNVMQLLDYMDVDQTIDAFFTQFKEAFMRTIPDNLATGLNKRNLLKNIKDLYRAKGTKKGHELFFRILLNEDADLYYPTKDMLRVSDGKWSDDTILRVYATNDTILMEDSSASNGDIFLIMEDGSQILNEENVSGTDLLTRLVGETITQDAVTDLTILSGGAYFNQGYSVIGKATAVVDSAFQYQLGGETITEFVLNPGSVSGTFVSGQTLSGTDNTNSNLTISAKSDSIVAAADTSATNYQTSQYFTTTDTVTVTSDTGNDASAAITNVTAGKIENVIVDAAGTGYEIGDQLIVTNTNTNGTALAGEVSIVNGGFVPETGTLTGQFRVTLESGTSGGPGEILLEESTFTYDTATGIFNIGETITGKTSGSTGTVVLIQEDVKKVFYVPGTGTFTLGETISGGTSAKTVRILTNTVDNHIANEDDLGMESTNRFIMEGETVQGDIYDGSVIVQEKDTGNGDITDVRVTTLGYGYTSLPTISITSSQGAGGTVKAKGTGVGDIASINIINQGAHYSDAASLKFDTTSNFLVTQISGSFTLNETVIGLASGATARFKSQDNATGIIKMDQLSATPFQENEGIRGLSSSKIALVNSYVETNIPGKLGAVVDRSGKFVNEDGFISDSSKKIQDSYYYQDYSYVVKTATSIANWRDDLLSTVHPGGWAVFGQVDIASRLSQLANITSISSLGPAYKLIWSALFGMRLGTTDQVPINPSPMAEANEPNKDRLYDPALAVSTGAAFTLYETITGGTSGATGKVAIEETNDAGLRIITYVALTGIFQATETITGSSSSVTATVNAVYGLRGKRDRTLNHVMDIEYQFGLRGDTSGSRPDYGTLNRFMFAESIQKTRTSTYTFRSHAVYTAGLPLSTLNGGINNAVTTITVADGSVYPSAGTIQIGDELIDYTGKSSNNLTGCTRGAHSTSAASHLTGVNVLSIRWAMKQDGVPGFRLQDWATDYKGTVLTIGDITDYPQRKNNISPPTEVTLYKT
tara:strand:- start:546 stop:3989 length:3444 start_codon:yes stop_codon:yes gene_type:complete